MTVLKSATTPSSIKPRKDHKVSTESKAALKAKGDKLKKELAAINAAHLAKKPAAKTAAQKAKEAQGNATIAKDIERSKAIMGKVPVAKSKVKPVVPVARAKPVIDLEEDSEAPLPSNEAILQITQMCGYVRDIQTKIADLTAQINQQTGHLTKLTEVDIPEAMKIAGLMAFTLADGSVVNVSTENYASYTKENEPAVFAWLRKNGHESIIKNVIEVKFGKGADSKAEALVKFLETKKFEEWAKKESIHAGTFKAFVREQLADGKKLPKQIAIFPKTVATIKDVQNGHSSKKTNTSPTQSSRGSSSKGKQDLF